MMEFVTFTAGKDDEGKRMDKLVRAVLDGRATQGSGPRPSMNIFQALRKGLVRLNGGKAEAAARVHEGDKIEIAGFLIAGPAEGGERQVSKPATGKRVSEAPAPKSTRSRSSARLEILFQNDDIMIINKPAGISVQPSSGGKGSISQIVREEWEAAGPHGSLSFTPAPLHRLDRHTSGALAISRSARGAAWFSKAMRERSVRKFYLGICTGRLEEDAIWEDWLTADKGSGGNLATGFHTVRRAADGEANGKGSLARTQVHPVSNGRRGEDQITLVQYELLTGRKHQIRAQSALHGHPLYGDTAYGGKPRSSRAGSFFLHAFRMEFPPDNLLSLPEAVEAPLPEEFAAAVRFFPPQSLQNSTPGSIIYQ